MIKRTSILGENKMALGKVRRRSLAIRKTDKKCLVLGKIQR